MDYNNDFPSYMNTGMEQEEQRRVMQAKMNASSGSPLHRFIRSYGLLFLLLVIAVLAYAYYSCAKKCDYSIGNVIKANTENLANLASSGIANMGTGTPENIRTIFRSY